MLIILFPLLNLIWLPMCLLSFLLSWTNYKCLLSRMFCTCCFLYVLHLLFWFLVFLQRLRKTNCCSVSCAQWFFCVVPKVKSCQNSFSFVTLFSTSTVTRKYCLSEIEETLRMSKLVLKGLIYATQEDEGHLLVVK